MLYFMPESYTLLVIGYSIVYVYIIVTVLINDSIPWMPIGMSILRTITASICHSTGFDIIISLRIILF